MTSDILIWCGIGLGTVLVAGLVLWLVAVTRRRRQARARDRTNLHGAVRMLDGRDIDQRKTLSDDVLTLGRLIDPEDPRRREKVVADDSRGAAVVYGEPGLGKTLWAIQAILRHRGSAFVSTTKDNLADTTIKP